MTALMKEKGIFSVVSDIPGLHAGVIGRNANHIDYARDLSQVRRDEKDIISAHTGITGKRIAFLNQVHGNDIICLDAHPGEDSLFVGDADALVTPLPGLCAVIRTADCVPLFLFDCDRKVLAAVHSGWRGSSLGITTAAAELMFSRYKCRPLDMVAFILPGIGADAYEVQHDVARHFPCDVSMRGGGLYLDLVKNITDSLLALKIPEKAIYNSRLCTVNNNDDFFSHRRGDEQRNLNYAFFE